MMASVQKTQKFDYDTVNEIFKQFGTDIRKVINTRNIIPYMHEKLSDADIQPVECLCKNEGSMRAADDLMEAVKRKPKSFVQFMYALHREDHKDIVDKIRDYLWKRHTTLLTYLDEKLQKKGLEMKSKSVMVVGPFGSQAPSDTPLPAQPPGMGHPLQLQQQLPHSGQGQPQFGQEPVATVHQQPVYAPTVQSGVPRLPSDLQPSLIHLPGTTNMHYSADMIVTDIPYKLFNKLSEKLCGRDQPNWKKLANAIPFLTRKDVRNIEKCENPGEALLDMLGEKEWTVQQLALALQSAGLQNELKILQENDDVGSWKMAPTAENFSGGQQSYVNSATIQEPVNNQQQQEQLVLWNQPQSVPATSQNFSEQSQSMQNLTYKQDFERVDENNFNMAIEQSNKREVGTKNLNIPGDADIETEINKSLDTLNISNDPRDFRPLPASSETHAPEPRQEPSVVHLPKNVSHGVHSQISLVSSDDNTQEMLMEGDQHFPKMLNTMTSEGQPHEEGNEDATVNVLTQVEDDPLGKNAIHNADIDRLHLSQDVHQQGLENPSLCRSFKDIHNEPGHVTMQMDSQLEKDAETS